MKTSQTTTKAPTTFNNYKIYANFPFSFFSSFSMCHEVCTVAETQRPSFSLGNTENAHIQICAKLLKSLFSGIRPNTNKQNKTNETVCGKKWNRLAGGIACERGQEGLHFATNTKILDIYIFGTQNNGSFHGNGH